MTACPISTQAQLGFAQLTRAQLGFAQLTQAQLGFAQRSERRGVRGPSQGPRVDAPGFTLIEIMIVLAIVGLIVGLGAKGLRSLARSDLRAETTHLAGAMRFLFDRASTTGKTHRLVLDLESRRYWAEVTDDKFYVPRDAEAPDDTRRREETEAKQEKEAADRRAAQTGPTAASDMFGSSSGSTAGLPMDSSYDAAKLEIGEFRPKRARFAAFKEMALKPVTLNKHVVIRSVYTPRATEPITTGRAYIYFFPLGQTEAAVVSLSDPQGEAVYSLVAHPITGRVRIYNQEVKPPVGAPTDDTGTAVVAP